MKDRFVVPQGGVRICSLQKQKGHHIVGTGLGC